MKKLLFPLLSLLLMFHISVTIAGEKSYPWELFHGVLGNDHCTSTDPGRCRNIEKCMALNWHWYENRCNQNKHPNQIKAEQLIGQWCTADNPGMGIFYYFEEETITEIKPGIFMIKGGGNWLSDCSYKENPVDYTYGTVTAWYDQSIKQWRVEDRSEFHCILNHQLNQTAQDRFEGCTKKSGYYCSSTSCEPGTIIDRIVAP